jgi:hypothetical protein
VVRAHAGEPKFLWGISSAGRAVALQAIGQRFDPVILHQYILGVFNMSKGSRPRPYSVSQTEFGNNFDAIFRKKDRREVEDAAAEDEAFKAVDKSKEVQYNNTTDKQ